MTRRLRVVDHRERDVIPATVLIDVDGPTIEALREYLTLTLLTPHQALLIDRVLRKVIDEYDQLDQLDEPADNEDNEDDES